MEGKLPVILEWLVEVHLPLPLAEGLPSGSPFCVPKQIQIQHTISKTDQFKTNK